MLKEYIKNEISLQTLLDYLNENLTTRDLQSFSSKMRELGCVKPDNYYAPKKLEYISINKAILDNELDIYDFAYFDKFVLQDMLSPFEEDHQGFIDYFCKNIASILENIEDKRNYLDNLGCGLTDITKEFKYYLLNHKDNTEVEEIIEKLGL